MKKKAFTLIELIAVLVILAILALIVTPLVMNIIRKARISADKRSIDAYGRSVELAIANYLLDNGDFPTDISELTIEYSGDRVECSTARLNSDSSVYLTGCTVAGRSVDYTYGRENGSQVYQAYSVGDEVTYNNINYYVIKDSGTNESTITLLKAEPLTTEEVNSYGGVGTENNHVNLHVCNSSDCHLTAYNSNGYGGMAFYSNQTCGFIGSDRLVSGCNPSYSQSDIKYVVDAWSMANTNANDLIADFTGYKSRLITIEELSNNIGYGEKICEGYDEALGDSIRECIFKKNDNVASFAYNNRYGYWTMSASSNSNTAVWSVHSVGNIYSHDTGPNYGNTVRPVITIKKSALE